MGITEQFPVLVDQIVHEMAEQQYQSVTVSSLQLVSGLL